jgi:lipoprotein LprG
MTTRPSPEKHRWLLSGVASLRLGGVLLAALVMALTASCGGTAQQETELPDGSRLLADSAAAMRTVHTAHFTISAQGKTPGVSLRYADGQLSGQGGAKGTAKIDQGGKLVDEDFVITGGTLYLRGPNGDYQKLPSSLAGTVYDPSVILNPDRGVAAVLASGKDASTESREMLNGVDTYKVKATFPRQSLSTLVPGITEDTKGDVWIATQGSRLVEAQFRLGDGLVSARFSDYDAPVSINSPVQ